MEISEDLFRYFQARCKYWINHFGLHDWDVIYLCEDTEGPDGLCGCDYSQKYARIVLSNSIEFDTEDYRSEVDHIAFHEICELLLAEIRLVACERYTTPLMIDHACHGVISRLTNSIWRKQNGNSKTRTLRTRKRREDMPFLRHRG
jgi:hypothetical protein